MILVDTCVLLDKFTRDPEWYEWSDRALREWGDRDALAYNPLIYAELCCGAPSEADLKRKLRLMHRRDLPWEAAWFAGKAFLAYLKRGGEKRAPLPDFYIGAHAQVESMPLLTRDPKRYRTYFPKVRLIVP